MGLELALVVVVAVALVIAVLVTGDGAVGNLTSRGVTENAPDYFAVGGGLMIAMIMGLATLVGFDSAANLAEEAKDPFRTVPRAIVGSVVAAGLLGLLFLITLTVAIDDIPRITADGSPVAAIMRDPARPGDGDGRCWSRSRSRSSAPGSWRWSRARGWSSRCRATARFPAHRLMRRVNPRTQTPIPATILIFVLGVVLMVALPGAALLELITASTILPAIIYGSTIVLYLAVRGRLDRRKGAFDLGRFELPVAICALVWTLVALFVLVTPAEALVSVVIVVGLLVGGRAVLPRHADDSTARRWRPSPGRRTPSARGDGVSGWRVNRRAAECVRRP